MKKPFLKIMLVAGAALGVVTAYGDLPRTVIPERQNEWWHARHEEKLAEISNRGDQIDLVFIGDSITHFIDSYAPGLVQQVFPGIQHLNLGFSADKTENVLWRLRNGELDGISPQLVIIMIGTNNTGHRQDPADVTAAAIDLIVQEVRQRLPDAQVILHSIFPRGEGPDDSLRMLNEEINALLPAIAAGDEKIIHLNINDSFLDQDEVLSTSIMPDLLHPNAAGYDIWMNAIEPVADLYLIPSFEPTISWDGEAGDGLWSSATNWTGDRLPGATDIVGISGTSVNYDVTENIGNLPSACLIQLSNATLNATTVLRMNSASIHVDSSSTLSGSGWWDLDDGRLVFEDGAAATMNNWEQKGLNTFTFNLGASGFTPLTPGALRLGSDGVHGAAISNATYVVDMTNYTGSTGTITLVDFGSDGANMDNAIFQSATLIVTNAGSYQASIQWNDTAESIELNIAGAPPVVDPDAVSWDGGAGDGLWTSAANWSDDVEPTYGDDVVIDSASVSWDVTTNAGSFLPDTLTLTGSATLTADTVVRFNGAAVNVGSQAALAGSSFYDFNGATVTFDAGAAATMTWWEQKGSPTFFFNLNTAGFTTLTPGNLLLSTDMSNVTYVVDMANYTGSAQNLTLVDFSNAGSLTDAEFQTANLIVTNAGSYTANLVWDDAADSIVLEMDGSNPGMEYDVTWDGGGADNNWLTAENWDNDTGTGNGDVVLIGSGTTANWNFGGGWHSPGNPAAVYLDGTLTASDALRSWSTVWNIGATAELDLGTSWLVLWGGGSAFVFDAGATLNTSGNIQFGNNADITLEFNLDASGFQALSAGGLVIDGYAGQTILVDMADYTGPAQDITLVDFSNGGTLTDADFQNFNLIVTNAGSAYDATLQWNESTDAIELSILATAVEAPVLSLSPGFPPVVAWTAVSGETYTVWFKTNITDSVWVDLGPATDRFTMPTNSASGFIRIEAGP